MEQEDLEKVLGKEENVEEETPVGGTILDVLKEKRERISEDDTVKMDVPGYGGFLVVEYKLLPYELVSKLVNKAAKAKNPLHELAAQTDIVVQSCVGFYVRPDEGEELQPLNTADPSFGNDPVLYDQRLVTAAGLTGNLDSARKVAQALFNNDVALVSHSNELIQWMRDTEKESDQGF